ncbi:MAG: OmcA/MtrC family decaheme c-type cytochrome, partial [Xanthomonadales bacterium]|nr:OmcA/MtrC family decaheme c-type cytochrome [Gammaproteobacteria bacterium]NNK50014.1 OmcA/MtrC family decaheme c-type cytochrome [Xanthomonadales bacterium]
GEAGMDWDRWASRPSRAVCGACHSNIDFENGVGHPAQSNDDNCGNCHRPNSGNEYDRSVVGAHTVTYKSSQLPGIFIDVVSVDNTAPGSRPLVTFSISDKFGPMNPATLGRLRFSLSGPNDDFDFYVQENALGKLKQAGSNFTYQFSARIPMDATGSYSFGAEGRKPELLNPGEDDEFSHNDQMQNFIYAFAVTDDAAVERRMIVDDATCENCHSNLSLHGENRHDANGYCQTCHMPGATDEEVRLEGENESIHFKYMIHKLHMGAELENGYVVYGYRSSVHDYSHVEFPGDLRNCESCHVDDSYNLPIPAGALPTHSPSTPLTEMMPATSACLSCHDSFNAAAHADANTSSNLGESCGVCHGEGKTYSVERVHAR